MKILPNWYAGARFGIMNNKEVINPIDDTEEDIVISYQVAYTSTYSHQEVTIIDKHMNYQLFVKYERNIHSFLWADLELYGGFIYVNSSRESRTIPVHLVINPLQGGVIVPPYVGQPYGSIQTGGGTVDKNSISSESKYFITGLRPSIKLAFWQNLGLTLIPGKIEYRNKTFDSKISKDLSNSHSFTVDFTPQNWMLGVFYRF